MNCKRIQELIITDYSDGEISPELRREINDHLKVCEKCRQFKESIDKIAVGPFKNSRRLTPPDLIWERIKDNIVYENNRRAESSLSKLYSSLRAVFIFKKPVFAFAIIIMVIVVAAVFMKSRYDNNTVENYLKEQYDFIAYLDADTSPGNAGFMNLDIDAG